VSDRVHPANSGSRMPVRQGENYQEQEYKITIGSKVSPHYLFRTGPGNVGPTSVHRININYTDPETVTGIVSLPPTIDVYMTVPGETPLRYGGMDNVPDDRIDMGNWEFEALPEGGSRTHRRNTRRVRRNRHRRQTRNRK
jgi:hypothetical protein